MSNYALMTLMRNLADALADEDIRVNQVDAGWTLTDAERAAQQREGRSLHWELPLLKTYAPRGSILTPDDVARHLVFWVSDASVPVSGQVYEVEQYQRSANQDQPRLTIVMRESGPWFVTSDQDLFLR
jgi:NAD(P)-dependent dehydrogenase (short-subunit alcohol dehydrogenase family)